MDYFWTCRIYSWTCRRQYTYACNYDITRSM
nr:MAG TPA: hypothetical protein [Bacteriophage sp.]